MRYFIYFIFVSLVSVIFSLAIAPILLGKVAYLVNLALLFLVFSVLFFDNNLALFYVLITGFLFDLYSSYFFGFYTLLLLSELGLVKFFIYYILGQQNLFTYLVLNLLVIIIWRIFFDLFASFSSFNLVNLIVKIFYQALVHFVIILAAYKFWPAFKFKLNTNLIN